MFQKERQRLRELAEEAADGVSDGSGGDSVRGKGVLLRGELVTRDLEALGLVLLGSLKACTPLPGRAVEIRLDLYGFVWVFGYPEGGCLDIWISSGLDMSGFVRICLVNTCANSANTTKSVLTIDLFLR